MVVIIYVFKVIQILSTLPNSFANTRQHHFPLRTYHPFNISDICEETLKKETFEREAARFTKTSPFPHVPELFWESGQGKVRKLLHSLKPSPSTLEALLNSLRRKGERHPSY